MRALLNLVLVIALGLVAWGCSSSSGGGGGAPAPIVVTALNGSTLPTTPLGVSLEISGAGFGSTPGLIRFTQGTAAPIDVAVTTSSSWTDASILVAVPNNGLSAPGVVEVTIVRADGLTSLPILLTLVVTPSFSPSSIQWGATQALPVGLRGHAAAAAAVDSTTGWVMVAGGNDGVANLDSTIVASVDRNGNLGAWAQTNALPAPRAFAGVALATPSNSPVAANSAYVYVVGGQQTATDTPGGTSSVYVGALTLSSGAVSWGSTTALPEARVGARAVIANGYLYVLGGLNAAGSPLGSVLSAPINADGSVGAWVAGGSLGTPVAFHDAFAFGGFLYAIGGEQASLSDPFDASAAGATDVTQLAPLRAGVVGAWAATRRMNRARSKASLLFAFGQLMIYEGAYGNTNQEALRSSVQADGALASFNGLTGGSVPALNVFHAAGVSSPLFTTTDQPRFLILGGDLVQTPGNPQAGVITTTAP